MEFLEYIGMVGTGNGQQIVTGIVRILLAALLGALIGMERERKHKPAGLRTHMLVCVASALVMTTNTQLTNVFGGDPTRMGAQVISGIGFLGAGIILTDRQNRVRGLTTAAGLWASACVGLAVGGGFYTGGIVVCALILLIYTKLSDVEHRFTKTGRIMEINALFDDSESLNNFIIEITGHDCNITSLEYIDLSEEKPWQQWMQRIKITKKMIGVKIHILLPSSDYATEIMKILQENKGMITMDVE